VRERDLGRLGSAALPIEAQAAPAGLALGCSYSSSAEYEAELIRIRRAAGAYGRPRHGRLVLLAAAVLSAVVLLAAIGL
jgi:hypothetical protein